MSTTSIKGSIEGSNQHYDEIVIQSHIDCSLDASGNIKEVDEVEVHQRFLTGVKTVARGRLIKAINLMQESQAWSDESLKIELLAVLKILQLFRKRNADIPYFRLSIAAICLLLKQESDFQDCATAIFELREEEPVSDFLELVKIILEGDELLNQHYFNPLYDVLKKDKRYEKFKPFSLEDQSKKV